MIDDILKMVFKKVIYSGTPEPLLGGMAPKEMVEYICTATGAKEIDPSSAIDFGAIVANPNHVHLSVITQFLAYIQWKCLEAVDTSDLGFLIDNCRERAATAEMWFGLIRYRLERQRGDKFPIAFHIH